MKEKVSSPKVFESRAAGFVRFHRVRGRSESSNTLLDHWPILLYCVRMRMSSSVPRVRQGRRGGSSRRQKSFSKRLVIAHARVHLSLRLRRRANLSAARRQSDRAAHPTLGQNFDPANKPRRQPASRTVLLRRPSRPRSSLLLLTCVCATTVYTLPSCSLGFERRRAKAEVLPG